MSSKRALAQQARRERERNERDISPLGNVMHSPLGNVMPSRGALAQRLRRQRERSGETSQLRLLLPIDIFSVMYITHISLMVLTD